MIYTTLVSQESYLSTIPQGDTSIVLDLRDPVTKINRLPGAKIVRIVAADEHSGYLGCVSHDIKAPEYCPWCDNPAAPSCGVSTTHFVYVCFRGTNDFSNVLSDIDSVQREIDLRDHFPKAAEILNDIGVLSADEKLFVHQGFFNLMLEMENSWNVKGDEKPYSDLRGDISGGRIVVSTGHSLGGYFEQR